MEEKCSVKGCQAEVKYNLQAATGEILFEGVCSHHAISLSNALANSGYSSKMVATYHLKKSCPSARLIREIKESLDREHSRSIGAILLTNP